MGVEDRIVRGLEGIVSSSAFSAAPVKRTEKGGEKKTEPTLLNQRLLSLDHHPPSSLAAINRMSLLLRPSARHTLRQTSLSRRTMSTTQPPPQPPSTASDAAKPPLVMQLIVDGSAPTLTTWPKGPWMAQSAHASIAAIQISSSSASTQEYISASNLGSMHKVVLQTPREGKGRMSLEELSARLTEEESRGKEGEEEFPKHWLWVEQPEGVATCLAIAPNRKPAALKRILRVCSLLKD